MPPGGRDSTVRELLGTAQVLSNTQVCGKTPRGTPGTEQGRASQTGRDMINTNVTSPEKRDACVEEGGGGCKNLKSIISI